MLPAHGRRFCGRHNHRWRRHGDPLGGGPDLPFGRTLRERFDEKVEVRGPDECWPWTGGRRNTYGHGGIRVREGVTAWVHRLAWEFAHGTIPEGLFVLHNCPGGDNPACCNPAHLWLGTQQDNVADMIRKGRAGHQKRAAQSATRAPACS